MKKTIAIIIFFLLNVYLVENFTSIYLIVFSLIVITSIILIGMILDVKQNNSQSKL
jgi:hypothetical protein